MFELIIRVVLASGTMALAGALGQPNFDLAWRASLFFAAYSYLLYVMEQRGARNAGVSGLAAVADSGIIAVIMADMGLLQDYGFVCAVPMLTAFALKKANAAMMAPLVAAWLMVGSNILGGGNAFATGVLVQALGILLCGLLLGYGRTLYEDRRAQKLEFSDTMAAWEDAVRDVEQETQRFAPHLESVAAPTTNNEEVAEMRESFRVLSDTAREIERRGKRDRACVQMIERAMKKKDAPYDAMVQSVMEHTGAEGAILFAVSQYGDALTARSAVGATDQGTEGAAMELTSKDYDAGVSERLDSLVHSLLEPESKKKFVNVILKTKDKIVGALTLFHSGKIELEASLRRAGESADFLASVLADQVQQEKDRRRLKEAELLYTVATTTTGAIQLEDLVARVARELWDTVALDHLSFWFIEDGNSVLKTREGADVQIMEEVSFAQGFGAKGWIESGAPFTVIHDARSDSRIAPHAATKKRVGSLLIVPLEFGAQPIGFVVATTSRTGGIDLATTETVRVVCAETSLAIARFMDAKRGAEGLATPNEFYSAVRQAGRGHFVYLEVPKKEALTEVYGKPAIEHAVRRFAVRLRSELPAGAIACRRSEGDYVVFVPGTDEAFVQSWSNDIVALASMIGVHTPNGQARIPLALRSKTAQVNQQLSGISTSSAA